jgi:hypothetical protein
MSIWLIDFEVVPNADESHVWAEAGVMYFVTSIGVRGVFSPISPP